MRALDAGGVIKAPRGERAHQRADARPADRIDRNVRFLQRVDHAEMSKAAGAAPAEHQPDSGAGQLSGHTLNVGVAPLPHVEVTTGGETFEQAGGLVRNPFPSWCRTTTSHRDAAGNWGTVRSLGSQSASTTSTMRSAWRRQRPVHAGCAGSVS